MLRRRRRASYFALGLSLLAAFALAGTVEAAPAALDSISPRSAPLLIEARQGHAHHHHGAPKLEINETEILMWHAPTPPSYYSHDFLSDGGDSVTTHRRPGLIGLHVVFMCLAFFVALPVGIACRSVKHRFHAVSIIAFWVFVTLGCASSALYRKTTPNLYEGSVHGKGGYYTLLLSFALSLWDGVGVARRMFRYFRSSKGMSIRAVKNLLLRRSSKSIGEYGPLTQQPEEAEFAVFHDNSPGSETLSEPTPVPVSAGLRHRARYSLDSQDTLHDSNSDLLAPPRTKRIAAICLNVVERALVFIAFGNLLTGVVTYTGGCRENYLNGCLAHLIKGGIFWCYGIVTFARYLSAFADRGWAWNSAPSGHQTVSAEFVESFVIFAYGATNTWMERFGANPGDPFTTKQLQHISIAVMFWFAGLIGMSLESKRIRRWLASTVLRDDSREKRPGVVFNDDEAIVEPPSYRASFNPLPAMVIGVTGIAMSAHAQNYVFQVQIHALWGYLLSAFAVLRFLTYFFLWLRPPKSILPSRPPTEALAAFFLAAGGLVFMFSTEELTLAAIRQEHDDIMMFLNLAIAITSLAFCWCLAVVTTKGWLASRTRAPFITKAAA